MFQQKNKPKQRKPRGKKAPEAKNPGKTKGDGHNPQPDPPGPSKDRQGRTQREGGPNKERRKKPDRRNSKGQKRERQGGKAPAVSSEIIKS